MTNSDGCASAHAVLSGRLFIIGGEDDEEVVLNSVECYDPSTGNWQAVAPMRHERKYAAACTSNDRIYVFGGCDGEDTLQSIEGYDLDGNSWTDVMHIWRHLKPEQDY